jgi:hypothetical protein
MLATRERPPVRVMRWWLDPASAELVERLRPRLGLRSNTPVLRMALIELEARPPTPELVAAERQRRAGQALRSADHWLMRTWKAEEADVARLQALAEQYQMRHAEVQALAIRHLAEGRGLAAPHQGGAAPD